VRFQPAVDPADHREHYNSGIAYKNRGMWYMAAQEWEAALGKQPREPNYLHALGLAYAQLKRYDNARATLDAAIQAAPDNQRIKESRALVDQMATKT
jgi:tetratricopeptide (TPR) repeat protein